MTKRSIIIPDARNHGNSPKCDNPSVQQMTRDLLGLQNQLRLPSVSMLGFDTGGRIAMMAALRQPQVVERLVVSSSSPLNTAAILARWEKFQQAAYIVHTILKSHGISSKSGFGTSVVDDNFKLKMEMEEALKPTLTDTAERALFVSNLGKFRLKALMNNPDMGRFPDLQDKCFKGPVMFISGKIC